MKRIAGLAAVAAMAGTATTGLVSGQTSEEAAPIYGIKIPAGYRDWRLISVNHLAGGTVKQVRAQLGNDIAVKVRREMEAAFGRPMVGRFLHHRLFGEYGHW